MGTTNFVGSDPAIARSQALASMAREKKTISDHNFHSVLGKIAGRSPDIAELSPAFHQSEAPIGSPNLSPEALHHATQSVKPAVAFVIAQDTVQKPGMPHGPVDKSQEIQNVKS